MKPDGREGELDKQKCICDVYNNMYQCWKVRRSPLHHSIPPSIHKTKFDGAKHPLHSPVPRPKLIVMCVTYKCWYVCVGGGSLLTDTVQAPGLLN